MTHVRFITMISSSFAFSLQFQCTSSKKISGKLKEKKIYERMMANETHLPQSNDELLFKSQTELLSLSHVHIAEQPIKLFFSIFISLDFIAFKIDSLLY